jgi:hypothetical protein
MWYFKSEFVGDTVQARGNHTTMEAYKYLKGVKCL